jgi:DnaD/phage-associated family protein
MMIPSDDSLLLEANMSLNFDLTLPSAWFLVPTSVAVKHLPSATEAELKVLLWLLAAGPKATEEAACEALGLTATAVGEAVAAWVDRGVFMLSDKQIVLAPPAACVGPAAGRMTETRRPSYRFAEVEAALAQNPPLRSALLTGQSMLGRTFSSTEYEILYALGDYYGLPPETILLLFSLCRSEGKTSAKAIEERAAEWMRLGITDPADAERYIARRRSAKSAESTVRSIFGIGERRLSKKERDFISRWTEDFRYGRDMIEPAYEKCVDATGKLSFAYIDRILSSWNAKGIATPEAAAAEAPPPAKTTGRKKQDTAQAPSYDIDKFMEWNFNELFGKGDDDK